MVGWSQEWTGYGHFCAWSDLPHIVCVISICIYITQCRIRMYNVELFSVATYVAICLTAFDVEWVHAVYSLAFNATMYCVSRKAHC